MAERVVELDVKFFNPAPNISEPVVVQSDRACYLIYWVRDMERKALEFSRCSISKFGYPNDEALGGHRLYEKGLGYYGFFEVLESEWIAELRQGNEVVFPDFRAFPEGRHFIITFHDSTFECIASGFRLVDDFPKVDSKLVRLDESL